VGGVVESTQEGEGGMSFEAKYHSTCSECEGAVLPGQLIVSVGNGYRHAVCSDDPSVSLLPGEKACTACFLVHPDGACDA
jgi:hypothetical protein